MERDPLRLAWTTSPLRHLFGFVLLALAGLAVVLGLILIRAAIDHAMGGPAPGALLRLAITLPESLWVRPIVLFDGFPVSEGAFKGIAIGGLVLTPLLLSLAVAALAAAIVRISADVIARLRAGVVDQLIKTPTLSSDEAETLLSLAARGLARENGVLGGALLMPIALGGLVGLSFLAVLVSDVRLGATLAVVLLLGSLVSARRDAVRLQVRQARHREGEAARDILTEIERRLPALRAHATGGLEQDRAERRMAESHRSIVSKEDRLALADAGSLALVFIAPLSILAVAAFAGTSHSLSAGELVSCVLAALLAGFGVREFAVWHSSHTRAQALLADLAQTLAALRPRERIVGSASLPVSGSLVAENVSAYDPLTGARLAGVKLSLPFPSHVALVGDGDAGPRLLASLIGGQTAPSAGRLTYGGVDVATADPVERAGRIAFAGETVLIPGSLKDNLLYGCALPAAEAEQRLAGAIAVAGLERLVHARGLAGTLSPKREKNLAQAIVEARRAVAAALAHEGLDGFVDPFDANRFNRYATVGENLLFGKAIGDTFREDRLSSHPFVRAVLEATGLTKPLSRMGLSIASSMVEIFAEVPDGHPLFERFSFFAAADRAYFQDLVERQNERRRGAQGMRDQERLIGLALRYNENRHRLGLVDEAFEARILEGRADFARMLPVSLKPAIEFYEASGFCAAASVQDNVLFGRIAADKAGAAEAVYEVVRRVLTERGLDDEVSRIGLDTPIDVTGADLTSSEIAAVELVRCLVRRPGILVAERALDGLPGPAADRLVRDLRRALVGRGLVLVTPSLSPTMDELPFDVVIRFERGVPVVERRLAQPESLSA